MAPVNMYTSSSDEEFPFAEEEQTQIDAPRRRWPAIVLGSIALAACLLGTAVMVVNKSSATDGSQLPTARKLLDSRELQDAVTDHMMTVGRFDPDDKADVAKHVASGLSELASKVDKHSPELSKHLDREPLTKAQLDTVINRVRRLTDPRVLSVGLEVAKEVKEHSSEGGEVMQRHLLQRLESRVAELQDLAREVNPTGHRSHFAQLVSSPKMAQRLSTFNTQETKTAPNVVSDRRLLAGMKMDKDMKIAADALSAMAVILGDILGAYENIMNDMGKNVNMKSWIDEALKFIGDLGNAATCAADMADKTTSTSSMSMMSCFTSVAASGMAMLDAWGMGGDDD